jgi:hypothetical protein
VVIRNGLKHRIPGFERIALGLGVASTENNWEKKTKKDYRWLTKIRHRRSDMPWRWGSSLRNGFEEALFLLAGSAGEPYPLWSVPDKGAPVAG